MLRQFIAIAVVASSATSFAAESKEFTVDVTAKIVVDAGTTEIKTKLDGEHGQPLKSKIGGLNNTTLELTVNDVPGSNARQIVAEFRLTQGTKVLAAPKLAASIGRPAKIFVGEEKGDYIEIELVVQDK